jgi:hypothetical protein
MYTKRPIDRRPKGHELLSVVRIVAGKRQQVAHEHVIRPERYQVRRGDRHQAPQFPLVKLEQGRSGTGIDAQYIAEMHGFKWMDENHEAGR